MTNPETSLHIGPGEQLRAGRVAAGLSEQELGEALKLNVDIIRALETNDFERLAGPAYIKGYLRACARHLGLDENALLESYAQVEPEPPELELRHPTQQEQGAKRGAMTGSLLVFLLLLILLVVWWAKHNPTQQPVASGNEPALHGQAPGAAAQQPANNVISPAQQPNMPNTAIGAGQSETAAPEETAPAMPADGEQPSAAESSPPAAASPSEADKPAESSAPSSPEANAPTEPSAPSAMDQEGQSATPDQAHDYFSDHSAPGDDSLKLDFVQTSWAEITDANDNRLVFGLIRKGTQTTVHGTAPFNIFLGNAEGVKLDFNGKPVENFHIRPDHTARFMISAPAAAGN
ncbi:MAG: DUF4115 domain-containing protein [Gammaproteobacteria bacterium]|jgi:cytoskeleton protein RodZ